MIPIVFHSLYSVGIQRGGITRRTKYATLFDRIKPLADTDPIRILEPVPASFAMLSAIHDPTYVRAVQDLTLSDAALRRIGFSRVPEVFSRPALSSGGSLLAAKAALDFGVGFNLAGGSHHAHRDFGSGYCVFNDVAVAARALLDQDRVRRITILDLDVHQGDGTATLFAGDPRVTTISVHGEKNFPARKARSDLDINLPKGTGDIDYMAAVTQSLDAIDRSEKPDILFYNAGVDIMETDKLGHLSVSPAGLRAREEAVFTFAQQRGIPIVLVLGGGYDDDKDRLAGHHMVAYHTALALFP